MDRELELLKQQAMMGNTYALEALHRFSLRENSAREVYLEVLLFREDKEGLANLFKEIISEGITIESINIEEELLIDLLITALEGGIQWCDGLEYRLPSGFSVSDFRRGGLFHLDPLWYVPAKAIVPLVPGCCLIFIVDKKKYILDRNTIIRGLEIMAKKYPNRFQDIVVDNVDVDTADVLIQCSIFGEVIYA